MAEQSLYRRHRPQTFDEVVGQEHVVRTLRNAVEQDRVHHAYLFVGSRGTGKTSMAKILARCLNCVRGPTTEPCGECDSCVAIAAGTSLDVIEMDAASNRSVDDIRDLRERVGYVPAAGRWKVYIIDEAHMLTREAWNAFLKTLEEPPPNTVFVLATTEAHKVMPTIVDRCQRFDFQRPAPAEIAQVLGRVADAEGIELEDGALGAIARAANGSFRDALGTLDQLVAYGGPSVKTDDVLVVLGVADAELIFAAADAIGDGDGKAALATVERLSRSGRDTTQFIRDLIAHLRQLVVVHTAEAVPESFAVTAGQEDRLRSQAETIGDEALVRAIDELSAAIAAIREWGDDPRTALELALLKATQSRAKPRPVEQVSSAPEPTAIEPEPAKPEPAEVEESGGSDPSPSATTATATQAVDFERVAGLWPAVLDHVRQSGSELLSAVFAAARPIAVDTERDMLEVGFPPSAAFNKRKAEAQANSERLAEAVHTIVGESLRPVYVLLDSNEGAGKSNGEPELSEDELIDRLKAEFDAEEHSAEAEERSAGEGTA